MCEYKLESLTLKVTFVEYCHKVPVSLACQLKYVQYIFGGTLMKCYLPYVISLWVGWNKPLFIIYECLALKLTWSLENWETLSQFRSRYANSKPPCSRWTSVRIKALHEGCGVSEPFRVLEMLQKSGGTWQKNCLMLRFHVTLGGFMGLASIAERWQASLGASSFLLLRPN